MSKYYRRHRVNLTLDLANHLRKSGWLAYTEIEIRGTGGRVDVAAIKPRHYARKDFRAYEVKESRADFRADEGTNKWRRYLQVFHRVYFATPAGLITKDEVPKDAGLIVKGKNGWSVVKAAIGNKPPNLNVDSVLALLFREQENKTEMRRLEDRIVAESNVPLQKKAKNIGYEIRRRLARERDSEKEKWAHRVLELCGKITGKDYISDSLSYFEFKELEETLSACFYMKNYTELLDKIGEFLVNIKYGNQKIIKEKSEMVENLLG